MENDTGVNHWITDIVCKLNDEGVTDLSDTTIETALKDCVCSIALILLTKKYRDENLIMMTGKNVRIKKQTNSNAHENTRNIPTLDIRR